MPVQTRSGARLGCTTPSNACTAIKAARTAPPNAKTTRRAQTAAGKATRTLRKATRGTFRSNTSNDTFFETIAKELKSKVDNGNYIMCKTNSKDGMKNFLCFKIKTAAADADTDKRLLFNCYSTDHLPPAAKKEYHYRDFVIYDSN